MKARCLALLLVPCLAFAQEGTIPDSELSLGGATIGQSLEAVVAAMGKPKRQEAMEDFIDLRYHYPHVRVSFNADRRGAGFGGCEGVHAAADAGSQMAQMYGPGAVRTIHNEEDAGRPR